MKRNLNENKLNLALSFRDFAAHASDGIYIINADGILLYVNDAFCDIVKMTRDKLVNQPFYIIYRESEQVIISDNYRHRLQNNRVHKHIQQHHILWNGDDVWLEHTDIIIDNKNEKKIIINFIRDITEKKIAEIELFNSEEYFRNFFKNTGDALFVNFLTEEKVFENFIEVNSQACKLLRYSREELLSSTLYDIIPIRDCQKIAQITEQLIQDYQVVFEVDLLTKNGRKIPAEINTILFAYKNRLMTISSVRDITERSYAHKQLSKSREQLRSLALRIQNIREEERSLIAREIHDELGQLLTVLKIQISLISKKLVENNKDIKRRILSSIEFIDQAIESVQKITAKLRPGILDELGLIPAIEWQAQEFEKRTGIKCDYSLPKETIDLNPEHSTALFRITQEALTNAARHSFAERVSIYLKKENSKLILEVTDNGKGIRESQVNNPNSLGLLGIKERAMVFGGKVSINGVSNRGTNLKVEWPLEKE